MIEQGTPEWHAQRLGKLTASRLADATAETKSGGWGASRGNYMTDLVIERLTGQPTEYFVTPAMAEGTRLEPEARAIYEFECNISVELVGFVEHPTIAMSGGSPDGLIGNEGLVEFKCPIKGTHGRTLLGEKIDGGYIKQIMWELACTDRLWCDWVSYNPNFPIEMRMVIRRVERDDKMIGKLEAQVRQFLAELDGNHQALIAQYRKAAA